MDTQKYMPFLDFAAVAQTWRLNILELKQAYKGEVDKL